MHALPQRICLILLQVGIGHNSGGFAFPVLQDTSEYCELKITSTPDSAQVILDGTFKGFSPILCGELAPGVHTLKLVKEGYITYHDTISLTSSALIIRDAQLQQAGALHIDSDPSDAEVSIDGKLAGKTPLTLNDLTPGFIEVKVGKRGYVLAEQKIVIHGGRISNVRMKLISQMATFSLAVFPDDAEVLIDGKSIGRGSLRNYEIPWGKYQLIVTREGIHDTLLHDVFLPPGSNVSLQASLNEPSLKPLWLSCAFPGLGQIQNGAGIKGAAFLVGAASCVVLISVASLEYIKISDEYDEIRKDYVRAGTETDAFQLGLQLSHKHDELAGVSERRNIMIGLLAAVYSASLIDVLLNHSTVTELTIASGKDNSFSVKPLLSAQGEVGFMFTLGF